MVEKVFRENQLTYPVPITFETENPLKGFPWLKPRNFLKTMAEFNDMDHILGGHSNMMEAKDTLIAFWNRYQQVHPDFQLFEHSRAGRLQLHQCIPVYIHGDEGVTYKKNGVLIVSWQSPLGYGSSRKPRDIAYNLQNVGESGLPLNFLKSGMASRLLSIICPKDCRFVMPKFHVRFSNNPNVLKETALSICYGPGFE